MTAIELTRLPSVFLLSLALAAFGCDASSRSTIPGGSAADLGDDGQGGDPGAGEGGIGIGEPENLEAVDFVEGSNLSVSQVGLGGAMTNNLEISRYVDVGGVFQLDGVKGVPNANITLSSLDEDSSEKAVDLDIVRSYDDATAWLMPKSLLMPGQRYKLHVLKGDQTHSQAFQTNPGVGELEAAIDVTGAVGAALHLRAGAAVHPEGDAGAAFLNALGLVAGADGQPVTVDPSDSLRGSLSLQGFLADDLDMDGRLDQEDLASGLIPLVGEVHGNYVRLTGEFGAGATLTVTGRLRRFDDGLWRLQGGAAVLEASCDTFTMEEAKAACNGAQLVIVATLKGETIYLNPLSLAKEAVLTGEGAETTATVELLKPRWVAGEGVNADDIDLSGAVHVTVLAAGEPAGDTMDASEKLVTEIECGDMGCHLTRVGMVIGDAMPAGVVTMQIQLGLQGVEVPVVVGADEGGDE